MALINSYREYKILIVNSEFTTRILAHALAAPLLDSEANRVSSDSSNASQDFRHLGRHLLKARTQLRLTQKELAQSCGLTQSDISKIESGDRCPLPSQLARLARELGVALQWFLTGQNRPGFELRDVAIELRHLGVVDLFVPDAQVPGAYRPPEQIVAWAVHGDMPDPRLVEALPAVLAWNPWNERLLTAYARVNDPRAASRLAWLADIALTIHRGEGFPGGFVDPSPLSRFRMRTKPRPQPDDLGHPAASDEELPPVSRRWNIRYAADLERFHSRARRLHALRTEEA
jgi:transcriptional regulator with XRE-family HTH domain